MKVFSVFAGIITITQAVSGVNREKFYRRVATTSVIC